MLTHHKSEKKYINYNDEPYYCVFLLVQEKHDNANFKKSRNGLKVVKAEHKSAGREPNITIWC